MKMSSLAIILHEVMYLIHYLFLYQYVVCHITLRVLHVYVIIGYSYCMLLSILHFSFMSDPVLAQTQPCLAKGSEEESSLWSLSCRVHSCTRFPAPSVEFQQSKLICTSVHSPYKTLSMYFIQCIYI